MFSAIFIRRPRFALVISLFLMLAGIISVYRLPIAEYPQVSPPTIMVMATYPGASAQVIADTVASPLESEVNGTEDMVYYSSQSDNLGNYTLTLTFKSGADEDMALVNVNNAVKRAEHALPTDVVNNGLTVVKRSSDMLATYAFYSDNPEHTPLFLSNYVSIHIKDAIARIDGIGQAIIFGEQEYSIRIWLDPYKMRAYSISDDDVRNAVASQNIQAATGSVGTESSSRWMQFKVDAKGRLSTPEEFERIIVKSGEDGRQIRLGDIAKVELGAETYNSTGTLNGKPAVVLAIFKLNDANALEIMKEVNKTLEELKQNFPDGMTWDVCYDSTRFVVVSMQEIVETLILTFILVVVITYLFLQDWRATIIPSVTIPVSLIGTFLFLYLLNMSINTLTMFALILVIGSLVDDAIIVVENCMRIIEEEHLPPKEATIKSMQQITGAILATTLVIVAIYAPVGFYGGMVGTIYLQFSVTMCIALCISTINALTLSPALCSLLLRPYNPDKNVVFRGFNRVLNFSRSGYMLFAGLLVRRVIIMLILFAGVLAANYWFFENTESSFLPPEDKGAIMCDIELPPGATLYRTEQAIQEAYEKISKIPGVQDVLSVSGFSFIGGEGENVGLMIAKLKDWSERTTPDLSVEAIQEKILQETASIPSAKINAFLPPAIMGLGVTGGVSFVLQATGNQTPQELASTLNGLLANLNNKQVAPEALYAFSSFNANTPQLYLDLDRSKAESMNIPISRVFTTLQSKLASYYVNDFNLYGYSFKVKVQSEAEERSRLTDISQIQVQTNDGKMVPLSAIASVSYMIGPRQIERFNLAMAAAVNAQAMPGVSSGALMKRIEQIVRDKIPHDYQISWTDMSYQERGNEGKIVGLMLLALIFGYLFLVGQYESWSIPLPVITSIAIAVLGGFIGLHLCDLSLSIYAQLGLVMLIGLASKNAILMVEFSKQERATGKSVNESALEGFKQRYRAVLMTAWSFIIGVYPMVVATGAGAGSRRAIGVTTFYGMLLATLIGIAFIPALYAFFQRIREWVKRGKNCY